MRSFLTLLQRRRRTLGVLAGLLLAYALLGFLLVPYALRAALEGPVAQKLGRPLTVGALQFNPFRCELRIADFSLRETDEAPLLAFRALRVNFDPLVSLFTGSYAFSAVQLDGPDVNVAIDADGTLNLARLAPSSPDAPAADAAAPASIPRLRIASLAVDGGRVVYTDRSRPQPFRAELTPIRFALSDFRTAPGYENAYRFSAATAAGEQLDWNGRFSVQPLASDGEFSVHGLLAATLDAYLQDQLPLRLASGSVDLGGRYRLAAQPDFDLGIELPSLRIHGLSVNARGTDAPPPLAVREIALDALALSLARRELRVGTVTLDGAEIALRREADGTLNLQRLVASPAASATPAAAEPNASAPSAEAPAAPAWVASVDHVRVQDASVRVEDRGVRPAARFTLAPIAVSIDGFRSDASTPLPLALDLTIDGRGRLHVQGTTQLQPLAAQLAVQLDGFELPSLQPYVAQASTATLHGGRLAVRGDLDYRAPARGTPQLRFRGDVGVSGFRASGGGEPGGVRDDFARWQSLAIDGIDFGLAPDHLDIARVTLERPFGRVVINPDRTLNVAQILKPAPAGTAAPAPQAATAKPAGAAMPVRVREIRIADGAAFFADRSIEPSFAAGIVRLHGSVKNLSSDPKTRATITLDGQVDRYSPVEIRGTSSLLAATEYTDLTLAFRNMELTTFNPYSGKFAGYNIARGKLTTELSYKIQQRELEAEHHVIVDQLEFGEATNSKDAAPLPIKLAVALLKDRNGVIDLQLPVRGSLDDPDFQYGKIVWKVLGNVVTKIVTAPFAALGSLFGGGEELSYVDFPAGEATLTPRAAAKLETLAKALIERPQLKLDVPAVAGERDRDALAVAALQAQLPARPGDDAARLRALEKLYRERAGHAVRYPEGSDGDAAHRAYVEAQLLAALAPPDEVLQGLARQRAAAVQAALLAHPELSAERIFVTTGEPPAAGDDGMVRLAMKLR